MEITGSVISKLPDNLQYELNFDFFNRYLLKFKFFTEKNFSKETQYDLINIMDEITYGPNEIIIEENSIENICIFIVVEGSVEIFNRLN